MRLNFTILSIILFVGTVSAGIAGDIANTVEGVFCTLATAVIDIAGAIASLVFVWAGIKWIYSADNPEERKQAIDIAKNVMVGLIIILIAKGVVYVLTKKNVCP